MGGEGGRGSHGVVERLELEWKMISRSIRKKNKINIQHQKNQENRKYSSPHHSIRSTREDDNEAYRRRKALVLQ